MKNSHQCPKCRNQKILLVPGEAASNGLGNSIMVGVTVFSAVKVNRYVCANCGYSEEWIDDGDLARLKASQKAIQL